MGPALFACPFRAQSQLSKPARIGIVGAMGYGVDLVEMFRRAAGLVDRILKGALVKEMPIEQPNVVELVLNLRSARALGIGFPSAMRLRGRAAE